MNRRIFSFVLLCFIISCKPVSLLSDYGIDKNDQYISVVVLPDTQYYTAQRNGGTISMFENQIDWILDNQKKEKISYVIHLGDITDHNAPAEWERARKLIDKLDQRKIPHGLAVGNHDQTPNGKPSVDDPASYYNQYFGTDRYKSRHWYGGSRTPKSNENHFDLFSGKGTDFLVLYFAFNDPGNKNYNAAYQQQVMHWGDSVLGAHADRKAILVAHSMLRKPKNSNSNTRPGEGDFNTTPDFTKQGKVIYEMARKHPNVFMMLGGHIAGESFRKDSTGASVIKTYLSDYQSRQNPPYSGAKDRNGGNGTMRLMRINTTKQTLSVLTFIPDQNGKVILEKDADSQFTHPLYN
ncbi:metallophosphoesterase [Niabella terrae]